MATIRPTRPVLGLNLDDITTLLQFNLSRDACGAIVILQVVPDVATSALVRLLNVLVQRLPCRRSAGTSLGSAFCILLLVHERHLRHRE